jgi:signal transduction histidine kinase
LLGPVAWVLFERMDLTVPAAATSELAAAYLQAVITVALAVLCLWLHRRYRKPYFRAWALAWAVYALRMGAIISFMHTGASPWLYWHQVFTGWTALALLWAALVFWRRAPWRAAYGWLLLFPPVWSYLAIYRLDNFFLAAGPAVAFLSAATAATAWAFFRYHRETGSAAARLVALAVLLWAFHHLDYPFLRARGVWNPWGYYLDLGFELALGLGILLLVQEDLDEGLRALSALSHELQPRGPTEGLPAALLERALTLRAVRGSALFLATQGVGTAAAAAGSCLAWTERPPPGVRPVLDRVLASGEPRVAGGGGGGPDLGGHGYLAALPVLRGDAVAGALVVVGEARDPFTALDTPFLVALGQQVGAALENADLTRRLAERTDELERLQAQLLRRHEEERRRISRELHDETAQVLAAVSLQLGVLQEQGSPELASALDRARHLVGQGIGTIRSVTRNLRPVALDDLGLVPALRALTRDLAGGDDDQAPLEAPLQVRLQVPLEVRFEAPGALPSVGPEGELALYRATQEGLANAVRHARARRVDVRLRVREGGLHLQIDDDGPGYPPDVRRSGGSRQSGLAGIRERVTALGGWVTLGQTGAGGARLDVWIPAAEEEPR